jgi:hypothetical protein
MGGYGGYRMATLYPHRFAGTIIWVGADEGRSAKGIQVFDFLKNLRQVPIAMLYSGADELVNVTVYLDLQPRLDELAYEHILYFHPDAEHLTYAVAQDWRKEAAWSETDPVTHTRRTLQKQPAQVTYRTEPFTWNESIGVIHDKAYWVSQIRGREPETGGPGEYADVDLRTSGCGAALPLTERTVPDPTGTDPVAWTAQEYLTVGDAPNTQAHTIEGTLTNVASLVIDTSNFTGACIAGDEISYEVTTNGPTVVAFSDGSSLDFPGSGTYTGTLPEPGPAALVAGSAMIAALRWGRRRH